MIQLTPPMGWNSWNTFGSQINEQLIRDAADRLVESGLAAYGYNYVVMDDCWSLRTRDSHGKLVADPEKFPSGIKALADYIHAKGLKFGMYSCDGTQTCAGYPGSYEHEFVDAATFAAWDVDFLKYDYCYHSPVTPGPLLYRRMGLALANCGRDILFSACSWGHDHTEQWIKTTGAHMWRSTGDIFDTWESIKSLIKQQEPLQPTNGQGCFNDMDMLVVGLNGQGNVGRGQSMTFQEYKTHFSAWCLLGSPLFIGCDLRNITDETMKILTNRDVIAINQDPAGRQAYTLRNIVGGSREDYLIYVRALDGGDLALGMFNLSDNEATLGFNLDQLALSRCCGKKLYLRELWSQEERESVNEMVAVPIPSHDCRLFRVSLKDAN